MAEYPSFTTFYRAANRGRDPLPWQHRLAERVATDGWPSEIGVPTGLGKTSCLDIAVWSLAYQAAAGQDRDLPTRVWYVVNRRLLVDAAFDRGQRLASLLGNPDKLGDDWAAAGKNEVDAVCQVAEALGSLAALKSLTGPLQTVRLRGGAELGARPTDPSQPTVLFATVPMFASRWLFRGYGTSVGMRPVDAALAGADSLVILDEAHLARALALLLLPAAECDPGDPGSVLPRQRARPRFVALTATGERAEDRFDLDDADLRHPLVRQRFYAPKPTTLVETTKKELAASIAGLAAEAVTSGRDPRSCLVFLNTPALARAVKTEVEDLLRKVAGGADLLLLTGRVRDREGDRQRALVLDPVRGIPAGRPAGPRPRPLVVVATQTLEVGADLDADHLLTQSAGVRALVQRFGRLNRFGERPHATGTICHAADLEDPVYGEEPASVWRRLQALSTHGAPLSLSPAVVADLLGAPGDEPGRPPELLPALLWEWVKTSVPPPGEGPVHLFFDDGRDDVARVSVCWRAHLPSDGGRLEPPVTGAESVDIPIGEARRAFEDGRTLPLRRLGPDRASLETIEPAELRPGDVVVLAATSGMYDEDGWDPKATGPVLDAGLLRSGVLPLTAAAIGNLVPDPSRVEGLAELLSGLAATPDLPDDELDPDEERERASALIAALAQAQPHPWVAPEEWSRFCADLEPRVVRPLDDVPFLRPRRKRRGPTSLPVRADAFEELSFACDPSSLALNEHLETVGATAAQVASRLGLPDAVVDAVRTAGRLHDIGKLDSRFQRWLDPDALGDVPRAKSSYDHDRSEAARIAAGWPLGGRHEIVSARLVTAWLADHPQPDIDGELVAHLVMSHHGHGRPSAPVVRDPAPVRVRAEIDGAVVVVSGGLEEPEWDQASRFRHLCERYGYWGLALLEAIVRQSDHAASSVVVA